MYCSHDSYFTPAVNSPSKEDLKRMFSPLQTIDRWLLRVLQEEDLSLLAGWMATPFSSNALLQAEHKEDILRSLKVQYQERRRVAWPHEYVGLLGDTPIFSVYGYLSASQFKYSGRRPNMIDYHLSMTINLSLPSYDLFWEPAWHLVLRHFFQLPHVACVITQVEASDLPQQLALSGLGFKQTPRSSSPLLNYVCLKREFITL